MAYSIRVLATDSLRPSRIIRMDEGAIGAFYTSSFANRSAVVVKILTTGKRKNSNKSGEISLPDNESTFVMNTFEKIN